MKMRKKKYNVKGDYWLENDVRPIHMREADTYVFMVHSDAFFGF